MRWASRIALGVLALAILAAGIAFLDADRLIQSAVEREGTRSLRLATTLGSARLQLFSGKLALHGLAIASPPGFAAPHMLEARAVELAVSFSELRREPIHVASIAVDRPVLVIEQSGGALNFRKAMERMPPEPKGKQPLRLVIDELRIAGAQVVVRPGIPGLERELTLQMPAIQLKDIGRGRGANNGAALREVTMQVVSALAAQAAKSSALPPQVRALLELNAARTSPAALGKALLQQFEQHR
jgi:hypothetical protein